MAIDFGAIIGSVGSAFGQIKQAQYQADVASNQAWYQYNVAVQQADYQNMLYKQQDELYQKEQAYAKSTSAWNIQNIIDGAALESNLITTSANVAKQNSINIAKSAELNAFIGQVKKQELMGQAKQTYATSGFAVNTGSAKTTEKMVERKVQQNIDTQYKQTMSASQNYENQANQLYATADQRVKAGAAQATSTLLTDNYRIRT